MDIRLFEYAVEIHKTKSFTKAAMQLHIAQPSLSKQIAKLEKEIGVVLFTRKPGTVETTNDGVYFIQQAEKILQLRDNLRREMLERKEGIRGKLAIGTTTITGGHLLPPLLKTYQDRYPHVSIQLIEESTEALIERTAQGLVDFSILALPLEDDRLETHPMLTESLHLVLPAEPKPWMPQTVKQLVASPEEKQPTALPLEWFWQSPFILLKQGYGFRRAVMELCARSGFEPQIAYETSSIETAQSLVKHGLGLTIVPQMSIHQQAYPPLVTYMPLEGNPTRTLVFAYKKGRYLSVNAKALINIHEL